MVDKNLDNDANEEKEKVWDSENWKHWQFVLIDSDNLHANIFCGLAGQ